jgi:hypothetical protein
MKLTKICFRGLNDEKLLSQPLKRVVRHKTGCGLAAEREHRRTLCTDPQGYDGPAVTAGHVLPLRFLADAVRLDCCFMILGFRD